jgi:hypothetical protein
VAVWADMAIRPNVIGLTGTTTAIILHSAGNDPLIVELREPQVSGSERPPCSRSGWCGGHAVDSAGAVSEKPSWRANGLSRPIPGTTEAWDTPSFLWPSSTPGCQTLCVIHAFI